MYIRENQKLTLFDNNNSCIGHVLMNWDIGMRSVVNEAEEAVLGRKFVVKKERKIVSGFDI